MESLGTRLPVPHSIGSACYFVHVVSTAMLVLAVTSIQERMPGRSPGPQVPIMFLSKY